MVTACVFAPLDQLYEVPGEEVSVIQFPWQTVLSPTAKIVAISIGLTNKVIDGEILLQPLAFVTITEYVSTVEVVSELAVLPLLHRYELKPAAAVKVVL